ncbi:RNA polymerase sigma factor [Thermomonospora umbrina]|uniref:RNA polymerase sigma-70 factor (ECF subfamily) n=1 Tax=Thermomonospora umbrina TaxID=111806 RepID=A0A3D9SIA2_9ACTN|nr:RNA polymerase sigma factor [Thermomonospora umbrina]REE95632.1 RNA polymerase sigma-70 factor (ECF subfamily) [Thermomonospora umbrina]
MIVHPVAAADGAVDDAALIAASRDDPERFAELYERHAAQIQRYIARRLGSDVGDDLMAETFLRAFRQRDRYDSAYPDARPWLYGIATNLISRHRRSEVRFFKAMARTGVDPAAESALEAIADRLAAESMRRRLAAGLTRLNRGERDVLVLLAVGLSYKEVARALNVTVGTVSSRMNRARTKMRTALEEPRDE